VASPYRQGEAPDVLQGCVGHYVVNGFGSDCERVMEVVLLNVERAKFSDARH
jgi:hypothetical protein